MTEASVVKVLREGWLCRLELDNPPAHALSGRVVEALAGAIEGLERDPPGAIIVSSAGTRFFSPGLDLIELLDLDRAGLARFIELFTDVVLRLFRQPVPVVAEIGGHAIAGGAVLALAADRRLAADGDGLFGLNEIRVGLPLPAALFEIVRAAAGEQRAGEVLLEGRNFSVEEALSSGLVHETIDPGDLPAASVECAARLAAVAPRAYRRAKELLHADVEERIARRSRDDPFVDIWFEPATQELLGGARDRLLARRRAAAAGLEEEDGSRQHLRRPPSRP